MYIVEIVSDALFSFLKIVACNISLHIQIGRKARRTWQALTIMRFEKDSD